MKPPICVVCNEFLNETDKDGGLVTFALTEQQKQNNKRFESRCFVGHPDGTHWFCGKHIAAARRYSHLFDFEAMKLIKG
jgi:hypothetical protein